MAVPQALIQNIEGDVNVTRSGEVIAVKAGDFLLPGDEVSTGATGRLSLEFPGAEGQIPAAGVMTANGKLTLGEQPGANGQQQILVLEDSECFEFTTELAENSAAAEGGAISGLFGAGLLGAGSGSIAGAGALAAGAFLGGSSDDSGSGNTNGAGLGRVGSGEFSSADSPQSLEEFTNENLTQENLEQSAIEPVQIAANASQNNPDSTPENTTVAGEQLTLAGLENVQDALVATTGEGTPQADLIQQLVEGANQTPLGEALSQIATPLVDAVNADLELDTLLEPLNPVMDSLRDVAAEVDTPLDNALSQITTEIPNLEGPDNGLPESPEGGLLGTITTGISSSADALGGQLAGSSLTTDGLPS